MMSESFAPRDDAVSPTIIERVERICDRFEAAWRAGGRPRIEDELPEAEGMDRSALLREFLQIELAYRLRAGERPTAEEYLARFPGDGPVVRGIEWANDGGVSSGHPDARTFAEGGDGGATARDASSETRRAGDRFRVLGLHREGGLGQVYVALDEEFGRRVALKEIRPDKADVGELRARFVLEAEINGGLEHPGIVPVYSLGTHADGRPFYAMRFVEGDGFDEAIKAYHASHPSPDPSAVEFRRLLGRFVNVCEAIAYAHSKGVLHRDLKPHNVMLGRYGETLLIDWGLAKATGHRATGDPADTQEATLVTGSGSGHEPTIGVIGTPAFMSPEQAAGRVEALGPATDVYGLGAILYMLLTATAPAGGPTVDDALDRARRGAITAPRQANPRVPAALEAVCLKALSLRAEDRYPTARALADDVERWLADEPVTAWREPFAARARRWTRRNRSRVTGVAGAVLAGMIGLATVAVLEVRANSRLTRMNGALSQALVQTRQAQAETADALRRSEEDRRRAEAAEKTARAEADKATAINDFLARDLLTQAEPANNAVEDKVTLREVLDRAAEKVGSRFADQPEVRDAIRRTIADTYHALGSWEGAERQWRAILESSRRPGTLAWETFDAQRGLGHILYHRGRLTEALALAEPAAEGLARILGPEDRTSLLSRTNLAQIYSAAGRTSDALALHESTLGRIEAKFGADDQFSLNSRHNYAEDLVNAGLLDRGIKMHESNLKRMEAALGRDHPNTLTCRESLATRYLDAGRIAEAMAMHQAILKVLESKLGRDHPDTLRSRGNLAADYLAAGRYAEALAMHRDVLKAMEASVGPDHPDTLVSRNNVAAALGSVGRHAEAIAMHQATLEALESKLRPDHPTALLSSVSLATAYIAAGRYTEAIRRLGPTLELMQSKFGRDHPETLKGRHMLASACYATGRSAEAIALFEATLEGQESKLGPNHPDTLSTSNSLATAYWSTRRLDRSIPLFEETLRRMESKLGPDHPNTLFTRANLGVNYRDAGRLEDGARVLEEAFRRARDSGRLEYLRFLPMQLATTYDACGLYSRAESLYRDYLRPVRERFGPEHPLTAQSMTMFGSNLLGQSKWSEAESMLHAPVWRSGRRSSPNFGAPSTPARCSAAASWARAASPRPSR